MGAAFRRASQNLFRSVGAMGFLTKLTTGAADSYGDGADIGLCFIEESFVSDEGETGYSVVPTDQCTENEVVHSRRA